MRVFATALAAGLAVPLLTVGFVELGLIRCIDSPRFLNAQALVWAGAGAGLLAGGAARLGSAGRGRSAGVIAVLLGAAALAVALAGPPYHSCGQFEGLRP